MSSANHKVRAVFELRVAALLAIVAARGGAVFYWLLETVAVPKDENGTQAESARALAYLIVDPNVCKVVLGRPHTVQNLLRFISRLNLSDQRKQPRHSSFTVPNKGKSMHVAAIMDVVISNCGSVDKLSFKPLLPNDAEMRDIAAAIEVVEEGSLHWDEQHGEEEDDDDGGGKGIKGTGIKVLGGTSVLGISGSAVIPGLWDDLYSEHVAVPFAAWALANWAMASEGNRCHIQELDSDGHAVKNALVQVALSALLVLLRDFLVKY